MTEKVSSAGFNKLADTQTQNEQEEEDSRWSRLG